MKAIREGSKTIQLYDDNAEINLHMSAIEMIALNAGASVKDVERIYEIVLKRFKQVAKVKGFLPILVCRRVKYLLDKRKNSKGN